MSADLGADLDNVPLDAEGLRSRPTESPTDTVPLRSALPLHTGKNLRSRHDAGPLVVLSRSLVFRHPDHRDMTLRTQAG